MTNKEDQVWVTISRTINLGNYNSMKIEAGLSKTIEKDNPLSLLDAACEEVFAIIKEKGKKYKKELKKESKATSTRIKKPWVKSYEDLDTEPDNNPND